MKLQRLPFLLVPLMAVAMLLQAVPLFISALNSLKVDFFLEDWQKREQIPNTRSWEAAHLASSNSLKWAPVPNGQLFSQQGELFLWQGFSVTDEDSQPPLTSALNAFTQDHQLRPTWPYPLLEMISIKMRLQETDTEFDQWVETFIETAQWRGDLLSQFVIESLSHWAALNARQRSIVYRTTAQALNMDRRVVRQIRVALEQTELLAAFCLYLSTQDVDSTHLCR